MSHQKDNAAGQAQPPEADRKKKEVSLATQDTEELDNQVNLNQDTIELQKKINLPNFLGLQMDNFADYLGAVPANIVARGSRSVDRKIKIRPQGGAPWTPRTRVQSLDREERDEATALNFLYQSSRSPRVMNIGALCQRADPFQQGKQGQQDDAAPKQPDEAGETQSDDDDLESEPISPGKNAECQIG
ncbi:hypothetical protein KR054_006963 [Drosophila jambulina]|nr:hypothetical protein KR054_006963 [Drosophila jambulina]